MNESPLGLFDVAEDGPVLEEQFGRRRYLQHVLSPWAVKRLEEYGGDIRQFRVVKRYPSILRQVAVANRAGRREQPGHLQPGGQGGHPQAGELCPGRHRRLQLLGRLCLANQGLLEFVEMFKAPIKVLHPLLTATQEGNYKGTEGFGAIPFDGIVLAHSNESEWKAFRNNRNNEAFWIASTSSRCRTACASLKRSRSTRS